MADFRDLHVAIIGAGMGGLGCALAFAKKGVKHIDVYEAAAGLGFVGAGIQQPPNVIKVLDRLGCWPEIEARATNIEETSIREGSTNAELSHVLMPDIRKKYGYPHCTGHRADLAGGLYNGCREQAAVHFHFSTSLASIESYSPKPSFTLQPRDGEPFKASADILLAADGIKSVARSQMLSSLGIETGVEDTGQAAYRIMLKRAEMQHDPEMLALLDSNMVVRWIGERRHIIAYPVAAKSVYNLSSVQPDVNFAGATNATYTTKGSKLAMLDVFSDFCPLVKRMLDLVPDGEVCEWKLRVHKPLPTWVSGGVALLGDACHPTLPHLNQGAAMAIEDGATLAEVISRAPDDEPATINRCLKVYESLRKDRTSKLVDLAAFSGRTLHLPQEEREKQWVEHTKKGSVPDKWASPDVQEMIYSYNCIQSAEDNFNRLYAEV